MATIEKRESEKGVQYRVRIRKKGYPTQSATFSRLTDAKNWANEIETAMFNKKYFPAAELRKKTFSELVERYIQDVLSKNHKKAYNNIPKLKWWQEELGIYCLSDITTSLIYDARQKLLNNPTKKGSLRSNATVNRYCAALSKLLNVAVNEWQWLENNPMQKIKKLKEPRGRVRFLSQDEKNALLKACKESASHHLYSIVYLALSTGARHGEIVNLKWKQVDFSRKVITLYETKNGEIRVLPIVGNTYDLMLELYNSKNAKSDLIFPSYNNINKPTNIRTAWEIALEKAGIEDFRFHDLRHSTASYLAMNGATLAEIAEVLGHKTLAMVKRYSHLSEAHTAGVLERMNKKFLGDE
ncbi:MAG: tyrosine-type recombinase/integrase [Alphaproteobacteria bacterium]